jgi:hypothetical protein
MSKLRVNEISHKTGTGNIVIPTGNTLSQEGLVVQSIQKIFNEVTSTTLSQTYVTATNGDLTITTKLPNSKIYVIISGQGYIDAGAGNNLGLQRTISSTTTRLLGVDGAGGDTWMGASNANDTGTSWNINRTFLDSPGVPAGTAIQYRILFGRWSTSSTLYINYANHTGGSSITLMEIAQ